MGSYTKTSVTYFNDIKKAHTIFVSTHLWHEIKFHFTESDFHDGLLSNKLRFQELNENECEEETNYEEILNKIFTRKKK